MCKVNRYFASVVNVVTSNPCAGPLPRIKISFLLLSIWADELISTPRMITFLSTLPSGKEYSPQESNLMPWPVYLYLSRCVFLVSFTDPNQQLHSVKWVMCKKYISLLHF